METLNKSKIFITNTSDYVKGELVGKWVNLPISENDYQKELSSINGSNIFISDWENMPNVMNGLTTNITTLNEYAEIYQTADRKAKQYFDEEYNKSDYDFVMSILTDVYSLKDFNNIDEVNEYIENARIFKSDSFESAYKNYGLHYLLNDEEYINLSDELQSCIDLEKYGMNRAEVGICHVFDNYDLFNGHNCTIVIELDI